MTKPILQSAALAEARRRVVALGTGKAKGGKYTVMRDGVPISEPLLWPRAALVMVQEQVSVALALMGADDPAQRAEDAMDQVAETNAQRVLAVACRTWRGPPKGW